MLWRGIDLSTFDVETLGRWIVRLEGERYTIQAEIDRRLPEGETVAEWSEPPTNRGAPPRRDEAGG